MTFGWTKYLLFLPANDTKASTKPVSTTVSSFKKINFSPVALVAPKLFPPVKKRFSPASTTLTNLFLRYLLLRKREFLFPKLLFTTITSITRYVDARTESRQSSKSTPPKCEHIISEILPRLDIL